MSPWELLLLLLLLLLFAFASPLSVESSCAAVPLQGLKHTAEVKPLLKDSLCDVLLLLRLLCFTLQSQHTSVRLVPVWDPQDSTAINTVTIQPIAKRLFLTCRCLSSYPAYQGVPVCWSPPVARGVWQPGGQLACL